MKSIIYDITYTQACAEIFGKEMKGKNWLWAGASRYTLRRNREPSCKFVRELSSPLGEKKNKVLL